MIEFTILGQCVSSKNRHIQTIKNGRPLVFTNPELAKFRKHFLEQVPEEAKQLLTCRVAVTIEAYYESDRSDLEVEAVYDLLQEPRQIGKHVRHGAGVIVNDRQVVLKISRKYVDPANPRVVVRVEPVGWERSGSSPVDRPHHRSRGDDPAERAIASQRSAYSLSRVIGTSPFSRRKIVALSMPSFSASAGWLSLSLLRSFRYSAPVIMPPRSDSEVSGRLGLNLFGVVDFGFRHGLLGQVAEVALIVISELLNYSCFCLANVAIKSVGLSIHASKTACLDDVFSGVGFVDEYFRPPETTMCLGAG